MAGDYDYGEDDFGDALPSLSASPATTEPSALLFDPSTRRHALRDDGTFVYIHPVDASAINALHIERTKFPAVVDTGAGFWQLESAYDVRAQRKAEDWAKQALKRLIDAGDVQLDGVVFEPFGAYSGIVQVSYTNLRLYPLRGQTVPVQL